jgi:REP element-mobilizing transposase RayT
MNEKVYYHYVFRTYKGKSVLKDPEIVGFLYKAFEEIARSKGFRLIESRILEDHVHGLVEYDSHHRIDYVIRMIKGISSRSFFKTYNTNRFVYRKLWGRSYFAEKIESKKLDNVIRYIKGQTDRLGIDKRYGQKTREPRVSLSGSRIRS